MSLNAIETNAELGVSAYRFEHTGSRGSAAWYLLPVVDELKPVLSNDTRVLDVGCGNGYWAGYFADQGCTVVGIDPSTSGIQQARRAYPSVRFEEDVVTNDLVERLNEAPFDLVFSSEVVEHLYSPHTWAKACFAACRPGGVLLCTTPYHGYVKNLAIALTNKCDSHWQPLREGGHIKFWSPATLERLLTESGFVNVQMKGAGRWPLLWRSMVLRAERPGAADMARS
ncbi:MAG: class I SAM-dependent methyltransferase [Planctomycetaceae bacterium]|nr:class I SAM-dependent methyltransferase [Planctomycetaceae bacterium]